MSLRGLYPSLAPFDVRELAVGDGHTLYLEQSGHPEGMPIVHLHGGPGAGAMRTHARFFDPDRTRVVLFDQRGVGKSRPSASEPSGLHANNTWHLVRDIVTLADALGLDRFVLAGGSWGATLALAFATRHAERLTALVLRGVTTFRQRELDWYFRDGASRLFPDAYAAFLAPLHESNRGDPVAGYRDLFFGPHTAERDRAVGAWRAWASRTSSLRAAPELFAEAGPAAGLHALTMSRLECLYSAERAFLSGDDALLAAAPGLAHIPLHIVQGRYDLTCPPETAYALHRAWPGSSLHLTHAGHSQFEPETIDRLVRVYDTLVRGGAG